MNNVDTSFKDDIVVFHHIALYLTSEIKSICSSYNIIINCFCFRDAKHGFSCPKNNFNRNIKIVCSAIFIKVKQKIKYHIKQGSEYYPRKSVISRTATDKSCPYRVNGKPIWTNICISTKTCPDEKLVWCRVNVALVLKHSNFNNMHFNRLLF